MRRPEEGARDDPLVEVGWVLHGPMQERERRAVDAARASVLERTRASFPEYEWRMPAVDRRGPSAERRARPLDRIQEGAAERELRRWDFALIVTAQELVGTERGIRPLGLTSRSLGTAVVSCHAFVPARAGEDERDASELLSSRLTLLARHHLGHLLGLGHVLAEGGLMAPKREIADLDGGDRLGPDELAVARESLREVADPRLEEREDARASSAAGFYLHALWLNRASLARSLWHARPWAFPLRLSRLTTASASALFVLVVTAEAWQLGATRPPAVLLLTSLAALAGTTAYVLARQRLLARPGRRRRTEQNAVAHAAVVLFVALGMATTYALLFAATALFGWAVFDPELLGAWIERPAGGGELAAMAAFSASLGILIGALGASFEGQEYVRHVAYVDDED